MGITGCYNGLAGFFSKSHNPSVEILQHLLVLNNSVIYHEPVVNQRLDFKVIVEFSNLLKFLIGGSPANCAVQFSRLTGRTQNQALSVGHEHRPRDTGPLVKILQMRQGYKLVEIKQTLSVSCEYYYVICFS